MTEEKRSESETGGQGNSAGADAPGQSGDPGRTPGSAEGDREMVEASLRDKEGDEQK